MFWSNWRGALVVVTVWVGVAWTQAYTQSSGSAPAKTVRVMTLYENGKAIRCRVIGTWKEADGVAHQLQAMDTGELITIVEAGNAAPVSAEGRRTIRTRNFHWGLLNRTPPRGCPTPPSHIIAACGAADGASVPAHGESAPARSQPTIISAGPPIVINSRPIPAKDEYVWWEEKQGKRVSPVVVTKGANPFEEHAPPTPPARTVAAAPAAPAAPRTTLVPATGTNFAGAPSHVVPAAPISGPAIPSLSSFPTLPPDRPMTVIATCPCPPAMTEIELPVPVARTRSTLPGNKRFGDRIRDFFNAKSPPTSVAAKRDLPSPTPWMTDDRVPLSTAADSNVTPGAPSKNDVTQAKGSKPGAADDAQPSKDWRTMWGQGAEPTVQQPGMSLMQAAVKPGKGPWGVPQVVPAGSTDNEDILLNPQRFDPASTRYNPKGLEGAGGNSPVGDLPPIIPTQESIPTTQLPGGLPPMYAPGGSSIPLGASSVIAASSGLSGPITYVPVPITTVPDPVRPPMPPPPRMPEAPQPTAHLNAFTPPPAPATMASAPPMPPYGMMPPGMMQPGTNQPGMMHPAIYPGMNPATMHPAMMNPGAMDPRMRQQGMMPPGMPQPRMHPGMTPGMPMGFPPSAAGTPGNPFAVARHYTGPMPPNPFGNMPAQPIAQAGYVATPTPAPAANVAELMATLRDSMYPAQREWAANQLANFDWRTQPEILPALLLAARHDPAATVRAGCVYSISRMNAATQPVMETLQALRGDTDVRVRQEVENALVRMGMTR